MIFVAVAHVHAYTTFTEIPIKEKENVLRLNEVSVTNRGLDTRNASGTRFYESSMAIDNGLYSISLSLSLSLSLFSSLSLSLGKSSPRALPCSACSCGSRLCHMI